MQQALQSGQQQMAQAGQGDSQESAAQGAGGQGQQQGASGGQQSAGSTGGQGQQPGSSGGQGQQAGSSGGQGQSADSSGSSGRGGSSQQGIGGMGQAGLGNGGHVGGQQALPGARQDRTVRGQVDPNAPQQTTPYRDQPDRSPSVAPAYASSPQFRRATENAMRREEVPPSARARVKQYFDSLRQK